MVFAGVGAAVVVSHRGAFQAAAVAGQCSVLSEVIVPLHYLAQAPMTSAEYNTWSANVVGPDDWLGGSAAAASDSSAASAALAAAASDSSAALAAAEYAEWRAAALEPAWKTKANKAAAALEAVVASPTWLTPEVEAPGAWLRAESAATAAVPATQALASSAAAAAVPATQASAAAAAATAAVPAIQASASGAAADQTAAASGAAVVAPTASPCGFTDVRTKVGNKLDRAPHISTIFQTPQQQQQQQTQQQWYSLWWWRRY